MAEKTPFGFCNDCEIGCGISRTRNMVAGEGEEGREAVVFENIDFSGQTEPDELTSDLSELTKPTTWHETLTEGVSQKNIDALIRAADNTMELLGQMATAFGCEGAVDGKCPVPEAEEIGNAFADAFLIHIMNFKGDA